MSRVTFKLMGENLFLIEFEHSWEKSRVLEGRPWVFERNIFSVANFDGITPPETIEFEKVAFWVCVNNLPLACMSKEIGNQIGSTVGYVKEVETDEDGVGWGKFLHVKIHVDLTKPLARGRHLNIQGKTVWILFQYERILRFCFHCKVVLHGKNGCLKRASAMVHGDETEYGLWLRVPPPRCQTRMEDACRT